MIRLPTYSNDRPHSRLPFSLAAAVTLLLASVCASGLAPAPRRGFEGVSKAVHAGKVIIVLRLRLDAVRPSGAIQLAGFQLDLEGDGSVMAVTDR